MWIITHVWICDQIGTLYYLEKNSIVKKQAASFSKSLLVTGGKDWKFETVG